jgi:hypothetical protein
MLSQLSETLYTALLANTALDVSGCRGLGIPNLDFSNGIDFSTNYWHSVPLDTVAMSVDGGIVSRRSRSLLFTPLTSIYIHVQLACTVYHTQVCSPRRRSQDAFSIKLLNSVLKNEKYRSQRLGLGTASFRTNLPQQRALALEAEYSP